MTTCRATTATLSVPVFDAGNISPHLAPLFPARRPQVSAPERATPWTFGNSCEDADTRRARCTMKPWLTVSEAAEYANVSRDTIYTACERARTAKRARQRTDGRFGCGRHGSMPGWNDTRRTFTIAGASATRRMERRHEPAPTMGRDQSAIRRRARSRNARSPSCSGLSVATLRAWRHRGKGPRFLRLGRSVRYLPSDVD